jgi:UbiD family decarboxylase
MLRPCATLPLLVPADSEIVLEGKLMPHVRVPDGPFMDYAGVPNVNKQALLFEVQRVAWRENAVFRGTSVGLPGAEDHVLFSVLARCGLADFHGSRLRKVLQNALLRRGWFELLQASGRCGHAIRRSRRVRN